MSAAEIIEQIETLSQEERKKIYSYVLDHDDSWIPEDFQRGMDDLEKGRTVDMGRALSGEKPPGF